MKEIQFFKFSWLKTIIVIIAIFILRFVSQALTPIEGGPTFFQLKGLYISKIATIAYLLLFLYLLITIIYSLFLKFKK